MLKDFRCAEMSSAMPTGAATASNSPISSTLAWRRPNFCGAADASRRTDYSAHTWQHAHSNDGAPRRPAETRPRETAPMTYTARPLRTHAHAGLSTARLRHTMRATANDDATA